VPFSWFPTPHPAPHSVFPRFRKKFAFDQYRAPPLTFSHPLFSAIGDLWHMFDPVFLSYLWFPPCGSLVARSDRLYRGGGPLAPPCSPVPKPGTTFFCSFSFCKRLRMVGYSDHLRFFPPFSSYPFLVAVGLFCTFPSVSLAFSRAFREDLHVVLPKRVPSFSLPFLLPLLFVLFPQWTQFWSFFHGPRLKGEFVPPMTIPPLLGSRPSRGGFH